VPWLFRVWVGSGHVLEVRGRLPGVQLRAGTIRLPMFVREHRSDVAAAIQVLQQDWIREPHSYPRVTPGGDRKPPVPSGNGGWPVGLTGFRQGRCLVVSARRRPGAPRPFTASLPTRLALHAGVWRSSTLTGVPFNGRRVPGLTSSADCAPEDLLAADRGDWHWSGIKPGALHVEFPLAKVPTSWALANDRAQSWPFGDTTFITERTSDPE
jgi:hypothetical protein